MDWEKFSYRDSSKRAFCAVHPKGDPLPVSVVCPHMSGQVLNRVHDGEFVHSEIYSDGLGSFFRGYLEFIYDDDGVHVRVFVISTYP